jgi:hypothetical protein
MMDVEPLWTRSRGASLVLVQLPDAIVSVSIASD